MPRTWDIARAVTGGFVKHMEKLVVYILDKELVMISWAVTFLVIGLIAAVLGFSGIAGSAINIAWILAGVGIVLAIVFLVLGRRPPI